jgi:hypothetical protein
VEDIALELPERNPTPGVGSLFLEVRRIAKPAMSGVTGFFGAHASGDVLGDMLFEMKLHFIVEALRETEAAE